MSIKFSTALVSSLAVSGSLRDALAGAKLYIYAGTEPAGADAALPADAVLLCTVDGPDGVALQWSATAVGGALEKDAAQQWSGVNAATGTASFFRVALPADAGAASSTAIRVQGAIGTAGADMNLSSVALTAGATQSVAYGSLVLPMSA